MWTGARRKDREGKGTERKGEQREYFSPLISENNTK